MSKRMIRQALAAGFAVAALGIATPSFAHDDAKESANIKLVEDFYAELEQATASGKIKEQAPAIGAKFIAPNYIQHMEGAPSGRDGFVQLMSKIPPGPPLPPAKLVAIMADGDKVIQVTSRELPDPVTRAPKSSLIWNMFRIENGQLAEHWDSAPSFSPPPGMPPAGKPPGGMMPPGGMPPGGMPPGGMPPGPPPPR
jgi:predicted SnoaL-like aldol condensation-catalyzing enzyme